MDALLQKFRACEESENRLRVDLDAACVSEANQTALAAKLHALFSEEQETLRREQAQCEAKAEQLHAERRRTDAAEARAADVVLGARSIRRRTRTVDTSCFCFGLFLGRSDAALYNSILIVHLLVSYC